MLAGGTTIGGYRIERLLGTGGMGTVYLAIQESLNRPVALKLLSPALTADETFRARFRREGEVQAALDHPHIVPVYEAGTTDDGLFLAMRYVRGSTLKDLIEGGELDPARTLRLLAPVAGALDAAHAAGLIHRDVKPQNILVDQTDWPYLADFGLTRGNAGGPTRTGQMVGTFAYIAPEQVKGMKASARSDQYALAAVLFECFAGEMPHNHESDAALLYAKVHEEPPRLSQRTADLPRGVDEVLARGMAREPDDRYPNASALLAALADALEGAETSPAARRPAPAEPPRPATAPTGAPSSRSSGQDTVLVDVEDPTPAQPRRRRLASKPVAKARPPKPVREPVVQPARAPKPPRTPRPARTPKPVSEPAAKPARAARPARRELPSITAPWVVPVAACLAAAIGFGVASAVSGGGEDAPRQVAAGELGAVAVPAAMQPSRGPAGLGLQSLRAYATGDGRGRRTLAVGSGSAVGPNLLPAGALADAARGAGTPAVARVHAAQALWFVGLRVRGLPGRTQVISIPTSRGVLVAACAAPQVNDAVCATALGSLAPRDGVRPRPVAASSDYALAIRRSLDSYESARAPAGRLLNAAGSSATQARAARTLRAAAGSLANGLRKLDAPTGALPAQAGLISAASRLRAAAGRLATAASGRASARYRAAASDVEAADRALRAAVTRLRDVYQGA
jgi:serine/threonine-protein kinase